MSSSSSAQLRTAILRGPASGALAAARLDADLATSPFADSRRVDARLVDPALALAVDEAIDAARENARQQGYRTGYAEGVAAGRRDVEAAHAADQARLQAAEAARAAAISRVLDALEEAAAGYSHRQAAALPDVENLLLDAAYDLATALLGRELESLSAPVRDAVRRALTMLPEDSAVTVYVHPVDLEGLGTIGEFSASRRVRLVPDHNVEPGSALADAGPTHVDASLSAALQRVREVLSS